MDTGDEFADVDKNHNGVLHHTRNGQPLQGFEQEGDRFVILKSSCGSHPGGTILLLVTRKSFLGLLVPS